MSNYDQRIAEFQEEVDTSRPLLALSLLAPIITELAVEVSTLTSQVEELKAAARKPAAKSQAVAAEK